MLCIHKGKKSLVLSRAFMQLAFAGAKTKLSHKSVSSTDFSLPKSRSTAAPSRRKTAKALRGYVGGGESEHAEGWSVSWSATYLRPGDIKLMPIALSCL